LTRNGPAIGGRKHGQYVTVLVPMPDSLRQPPPDRADPFPVSVVGLVHLQHDVVGTFASGEQDVHASGQGWMPNWTFTPRSRSFWVRPATGYSQTQRETLPHGQRWACRRQGGSARPIPQTTPQPNYNP